MIDHKFWPKIYDWLSLSLINQKYDSASSIESSTNNNVEGSNVPEDYPLWHSRQRCSKTNFLRVFFTWAAEQPYFFQPGAESPDCFQILSWAAEKIVIEISKFQLKPIIYIGAVLKPAMKILGSAEYYE